MATSCPSTQTTPLSKARTSRIVSTAHSRSLVDGVTARREGRLVGRAGARRWAGSFEVPKVRSGAVRRLYIRPPRPRLARVCMAWVRTTHPGTNTYLVLEAPQSRVALEYRLGSGPQKMQEPAVYGPGERSELGEMFAVHVTLWRYGFGFTVGRPPKDARTSCVVWSISTAEHHSAHLQVRVTARASGASQAN
eukprot:4738904-Prymnesium_polylepis.1